MRPEAIILAGGKGTRLQAVVKDVPKPMAPVAERPFLTYLLDQLNQAGIEKVYLSVGYKHEVITNHFGAQYKDIQLNYVVENEPLGTGGGIKLAAKQVTSDNFYVINGDTYFDIDFEALESFYHNQNFDACLALSHVENASRYGTVQLTKDQRISRFAEKEEASKDGLINGGIYLVNKHVFLKNAPLERFSMEQDFLQKYVDKLNIGGFVSDGYFIDIGIPEDYLKANEYFAQ